MNLHPDSTRSARDDQLEWFPLPPNIYAERDVKVAMRDGIRLALNVYRPPGEARLPVILACTRYGKDDAPAHYLPAGSQMRRAIGCGFGDVTVSDATPFEAPDPAYWVPHGYAVIHVDARGTGKSEGRTTDTYSEETIDDFCEIVDWAATQPWSNGAVGLNGVSYLAIVQYRIAAKAPRGLKAIIPWEGQADRYRDAAFHGGIPETGFMPWITAGMPGIPGSDEDPVFGAVNSPLATQVSLFTSDLEAIRIPMLVCASWSDQGLHTRGSMAAFIHAQTPDKWLYTHGRGKWTLFHSREASDYQRAFYDRFLKGDRHAMDAKPRVRLEVRRDLTHYEVRGEDAWPPSAASVTPLWLDAATGRLTWQQPATEASAQYVSRNADFLHYTMRFDTDTEISGPMALTLWMSTDAGEDMDVFVGMRKFDQKGNEVHFEARENDRCGIVAVGWLRASHRKIDPQRSTALQPYHSHDEYLQVTPDEVIALDIEILPSSTLFEAGSTLVLTIGGRDVWGNRMCQHRALRNDGHHVIYTGGRYPSRLRAPIVRR
jgi:predicted acyl esterase